MRRRGNVVFAADLFCGAGGTSQGLARACERLGRDVDLVAINHWPRAVATHEFNHPWARHYCARIESLDPRRAVPGGELDLVVAGVECTHHSRARGGKPMSDQSRASAWHVLHWAEQLHVREILIENVAEFAQWGPLDDDGKPIPEMRGSIFRAFVAALEAMNYRVEWRLLTAADYGDPTTRRRFFLRARLGGQAIDWPKPSHAQDGGGGLARWRSAREIIDWTDLGESIFRRKKPLADRTIARIAEGVRRFCGDYAEPFLVMLYGSNSVRSVDRPLPTVTAQGGHVGLAQPFLFQANQGNKTGPRVNSVDRPVGTVMTKNHLAVVTPFLTMLYGNSDVRSLDLPAPTVTAGPGHIALATPFILPHDQFTAKNGVRIVDSVARPLRTVTAANGANNYLVSPFIVPHFGERPGQVPRTHSLDEPAPTETATKGAGSLVLPFLVPYYGTGVARSIDEPIGTVTTHDRFALVSPEYAADIYFRMLQPAELALAQGFPAEFRFTGTKTEVVRQIGNAVPVGMAEGLCFSILSGDGFKEVA